MNEKLHSPRSRPLSPSGYVAWREAFYPRPASRVASEDAVAHSLTKWRGLLPSVLAIYGGKRVGAHVEFAEDQRTFKVDAISCALCAIHLDATEHRPLCYGCPIFLSRGARCDEPTAAESKLKVSDPYSAWVHAGNPHPMIAALEVAQAFEDEQAAREHDEEREERRIEARENERGMEP